MARIGTDTDVIAAINAVVVERIAAERREVDRLILDGANRVERPYLPGTSDPRRIVYTVPGWRRHPRARVKVELARIRHRYRERQARWGG